MHNTYYTYYIHNIRIYIIYDIHCTYYNHIQMCMRKDEALRFQGTSAKIQDIQGYTSGLYFRAILQGYTLYSVH